MAVDGRMCADVPLDELHKMLKGTYLVALRESDEREREREREGTREPPL